MKSFSIRHSTQKTDKTLGNHLFWEYFPIIWEKHPEESWKTRGEIEARVRGHRTGLYRVASKWLLFIDVITNECEAIPGPDLVFETMYMILSSGNYTQSMLAA